MRTKIFADAVNAAVFDILQQPFKELYSTENYEGSAVRIMRQHLKEYFLTVLNHDDSVKKILEEMFEVK